MAYNPSTQVISAPVSLGDIASALGGGSLDLGTLCTSAGINKWAKYKPVRHKTTGILTEEQRAREKCGLSFNTYETVTAMVTAVGNGTDALTSWLYVKPRGGSSNPPEWFRALDFDGYWGGAVAPVRQCKHTSYVIHPGSVLDVEFNGFDVIHTGMLKFDDIYVGGAINRIGDMYLSLCMYRPSSPGTTAHCLTSRVASSTTQLPLFIRDAYDHGANFKSRDFSIGTWNMFMFASSVDIASLQPGSDVPSGVFIPFAFDEGNAMTLSTNISFTQGAAEMQYGGNADRCSYPDGYDIHYHLYVTLLNDITTQTITDIYITLKDIQGAAQGYINIPAASFVPASTPRTATVDGTTTLSVRASDIALAEYQFLLKGSVYTYTVQLTDNPANS